MFYIISRDHVSGKLGVLDSSDYVVEFYDFCELKDFVKKGIEINGFSYNGKTWDISISKAVFPPRLMSKIRTAAITFDEDNSDEIIKFLTSYYSNMQKRGENLAELSIKLSVEDIIAVFS